MATVRRSTRDRTDIELLRAVGALAVVCIHVSAPGVIAGPAAGGGGYYATSLVIDSASTFAVPLFFAIAGWVLLVRRPAETEGDLWQRVGRVLRPLLTWSLIYLAWPLTGRHGSEVAGAFLGVPVTIHLWFLYAYVPLVLVVGMITLLLGHQELKRLWLLILALAFAAMAPSMLHLETLVHRVPAHSDLQIYLWVLFYALAGAALLSDRVANDVSRAWGGTLLIVATIGGVWWARLNGYADPLAAGSLVAATGCIGVLLLLRGVELRGRAREMVHALGRASFGVYLAHVLVLTGLDWLLERLNLFQTPRAHAITLPLLVLVTFAVSASLSLGWSRNPRLRRWLG